MSTAVNLRRFLPPCCGKWFRTLAVLYLRLRPALQSVSGATASKPSKGNAVFLLILDSLGNSELLLILAAALIFFGPRRLPQLSRQLGRSLHEFRRASEDFKRTWEREVNLEDVDKGIDPQLENSILDKAAERIRSAREAAALDSNSAAPSASVITPSVTAIDPSLVQPREVKPPETVAADQTPGKRDWL